MCSIIEIYLTNHIQCITHFSDKFVTVSDLKDCRYKIKYKEKFLLNITGTTEK